MRILTISHTAGSRKHGMLFRPFYLSREFVSLGHEASIVSASYFHTRHLNPVVLNDLDEETLDGVKFIWLKTMNYGYSESKRALAVLTFAFKSVFYARQLARTLQPDVVIATSPDPLVILGAWRIARISRATLVFEFRDIWPLTLIELGGKSRWHPFILLLRYAELFALRVADLVVSVLPRADRYLRDIKRVPRRFAVIPNGVSIPESTPLVPKEGSPLLMDLKKLRDSQKFMIGYVGHHGVATALKPLLEAMTHLDRERYGLVLLGDGPDKQSLLETAKQLGLDNVSFFAPVPRSEAVAALAFFDACYIGSPQSIIYRYGASPNKVYDYMIAGKPIISGIDSDVDPILDAGCGVKVRGSDSKNIAAGIKCLSDMSVSEREALGQSGRDYVSRHHEFRGLAERYLHEVKTARRMG